MTDSTARLLFLRLSGIFTQGALLIAATVLFAFGMLELFQTLACLALIIAWAISLPAAVRARARDEYIRHDLGHTVDERGDLKDSRAHVSLLEPQYTRLRAVSVRRRTRKTLNLTRDRFDLTAAAVASLVWLSYLGFLSSVAIASAS